jgi:hypothetical protein
MPSRIKERNRRKENSSKGRIKSVNLKEGSYSEYIRRKFGKDAFTPQGTIKLSISKKLLKDPSVSPKTKRRARLHLQLINYHEE